MLIFFGMLLVAFVYVYFFIPEVKGLSLEEVDELYRAHVVPWRSAGWRPAEKNLPHHGMDNVTDVAAEEMREEKVKF